MRTDLTVRTSGGTDVDIAILAPAGTTWSELCADVCAAADVAEPLWCGRRTLHPTTVIGGTPLVTGAIITTGRSAPEIDSTMRLEVVGGRDCGASIPVGNGVVTVGRARDCDLVLTDPHISRHHATVQVTAFGVTVVDLDSTDGLRTCDGDAHDVRLAHDTVVRIGATYLAVSGLAGATRSAGAVGVPDAPTPPSNPTRVQLLATLAPAVIGGGLAVMTGAWEFLAFAVLTPVATLAGTLGERRHARRNHRRAVTRYKRELARCETELRDALRREAVHRRREHPPPSVLQRRTATTDHVRVGLGTMPSRVQSTGVVIDVPVTVDLTAGPIALVGPREVCRDIARALVMQAAAQGFGVATARYDEWRWTRWLPTVAGRTLLVVDGAQPPETGLTVVLVDAVADVPAACTTRIVATGDEGVVQVHQPDGSCTDAIADRVTARRAERMARSLAARTPPAATTIPSHCHLRELIGDAELQQRWSVAGDSLRTTVGVGADGPVSIDLDRDGPHVLVAGSTGAGKSELLQSLVAGLATEQPPTDVSFLLIDYKGGAAFGACADLPHTVGLVTDLDEQLTRRVLTALDSELRRRERLFATCGAGDLMSYRTSACAEPVARLVIVVDEFATLADELGDFVSSLVAIARRGRSLGLHLVLATQRPSGVVSPEIRANTAVRICLRVTSAAESMDVVDTAAAAAIAPTTPGRAILRTGSIVREFQTALVTSAPRDDDGPQVVTLGWWRELPEPARSARETDLQRLVAAARATDETSPPHRPWLEPLPSRLPISTLDTADGVVIGRVDLPADQRQPPLTIDVANGTTVLISGRPRSGRSTALHTIAHAAATRHPPSELHIYGIDATGTRLTILRALPHTGTIATVVDGFDFAARLVERLLTSPHRSLLLIDGWDELLVASDDHDGGRTAERVTTLLRAAGHRQLTVVVAGGRATLAPRLTTLATSTYVLALNDAAEYAAAGVPAHGAPLVPPSGRAVRSGDWAHVQFAIVDEPTVVEGPPARDAIRMRPLPDSIRLAQLASTGGVVLGVCGDDCAPAVVDLVATDAQMLVAGPPRSGCSTVLHTVLEQSAQCAVVASARSPLLAAAGAQKRVVVSTADDLPDSGLLLVDDVHLVADTALGDAIAAWADAGVPGRAVVAAGRADAVALGYRGLIGQLRAHSCGIVLRPRAADGTILGIDITPTRAVLPAGRGILVPDPRWGLGAEAVAIQVALP